MSGRFAFPPEWVNELLASVQDQHHHDIFDARILVIFDLKPRKRDNRYVFASIKRAQDEIKLLHAMATENEVDYILRIDQAIFMRMSDEDRVHLLRHELSHCRVEFTEEETIWRTVGHDYEVFAWEVEDEDWRKRRHDWAALAAACHEADVRPPENDPTAPTLPFDDEREGDDDADNS